MDGGTQLQFRCGRTVCRTLWCEPDVGFWYLQSRDPAQRSTRIIAAMDTQLIGVICAVIGAVLVPLYLKLGFSGLKTLQQIRDNLKQR